MLSTDHRVWIPTKALIAIPNRAILHNDGALLSLTEETKTQADEFFYTHPLSERPCLLSTQEKQLLLLHGRFGNKTSSAEWGQFCAKLKESRGGVFPTDWGDAVLLGRLFKEENNDCMSSEDISINDGMDALLDALHKTNVFENDPRLMDSQ